MQYKNRRPLIARTFVVIRGRWHLKGLLTSAISHRQTKRYQVFSTLSSFRNRPLYEGKVRENALVEWTVPFRMTKSALAYSVVFAVVRHSHQPHVDAKAKRNLLILLVFCQ